jgi:arabinose-5-phosphate isomerase
MALEVTFNVDITNFLLAGNSLGATGIRIAGTFLTLGATVNGSSMAFWNPIDASSAMINNGNNIYLSGMGKSGYVCKKSASTWQSLSLKCSYIDLPNLPHGDFGILRDGDILILISNNGNTDEIIYILNYLKNNLNKKITTISIVANKNSEMEKLSTFTYVLENIKEADLINMTPSTSSLIFMAVLDGIAINLKQNITIEQFKIYHPAGSLGKR